MNADFYGDDLGWNPIEAAKGVFRSVKSAIKTTKKSAGDVVRLPGQIAQGVGAVAKGAGSTAKTVPIILGVLAVGIAGYAIYMGKAGKKITPTVSGGFPELLGRSRSRRKRRR